MIEVLKQKHAELSGMLSYYFRAFTIFLAVTGALLKFALDQSSTPQLRHALSWMGIGVSVLGLLSGLLGIKLRRTLRGELASVYSVLGVPLKADNMTAVGLMIVIALIFGLVALGAWVYLLTRG